MSGSSLVLVYYVYWSHFSASSHAKLCWRRQPVWFHNYSEGCKEKSRLQTNSTSASLCCTLTSLCPCAVHGHTQLHPWRILNNVPPPPAAPLWMCIGTWHLCDSSSEVCLKGSHRFIRWIQRSPHAGRHTWMRMFTTPTIHNQSVMFSDCSPHSHPRNSKRPFKSRGIWLGWWQHGKENLSPPFYLGSHFSARQQEMWFTLPELFLLLLLLAMPRGHDKQTCWSCATKYFQDQIWLHKPLHSPWMVQISDSSYFLQLWIFQMNHNWSSCTVCQTSMGNILC